MTALDKLKSSLAATSYKSTFFDVEIEGVDDDTKQSVSRNEEVFIIEFKKSSVSLIQQCKALNEINQALKKDGMFMEWCKHVCLTKDKASELLKRHELYTQFPENHLWVSSLSVSAVKILTHKNLELEQLYDIAELELRSVDDIREYLSTGLSASNSQEQQEAIEDKSENSNDEIIIEFEELKSNIKNIKNSDNIPQYKAQIVSIKKELDELEVLIKIQEDNQVNKNNLNLFEDITDEKIKKWKCRECGALDSIRDEYRAGEFESFRCCKCGNSTLEFDEENIAELVEVPNELPADEPASEKIIVDVGDKFFYLRDTTIFEIEILEVEKGEYITTNIPFPTEAFKYSNITNLTKILDNSLIQPYDELDSTIKLYAKTYNTSLKHASEDEIKEYTQQNRNGNYIRLD